MSLYIIMMGVQGAGKGMQAGLISEAYNIPHVSTGDIFRGMQNRDDDLAREVKAILEAGKLVDDDLTCRIVEDRLGEDDAANGVILDGFPRNDAQAEWLDDYLSSKGTNLTGVFWFELDLFIAFKRAYGRIQDDVTKESHNVYYNADGIESWEFVKHPDEKFAPRLDSTLKSGNPVKRRADDENAHSVVTRIDTYMAETAPLLDYYKKQGLVVNINADQEIEAVTEDIKAAIETRKAKV
ncbi:MAG: nucleoside monophosphate kinase [Chloroflexota bacterium]